MKLQYILFFVFIAVLSLFTYVQFQNPECIAADGGFGTCTSASDCIARGGIINGQCAGAYGACCVCK